tara:strand:- start:1021 stop:1470 length:450 start_codon:yes stop_codon:yes gene_type:complete
MSVQAAHIIYPNFLSLISLLKRISIIPVLLILIGCSNPSPLDTVVIKHCYDGDTCTTSTGEKLRLACIDTPELKGNRADPIPAKAARDYLNGLVAGETLGIRRITKDRYGRTVAELSKNEINVQEHLVALGLAKVYTRYASQCDWTKQT